ncbi:hypothetical protein OG612_45525 (plasmid) [Streptomyces sp. NBC_01527]|uniref:hypothetical protein n=1 Tax=Streptomyces sp. NBC_01527 TaxID=2903894 RepID=UPI002F919411
MVDSVTVPGLPAGSFELPAAFMEYGLGQHTTSANYPVLQALLDDAVPSGDGSVFRVGLRPVTKYGTGGGRGFSKAFELHTVANALSNMACDLREGRLSWYRLKVHGITPGMLSVAQQAVAAADREVVAAAAQQASADADRQAVAD